MKKLSLVLTALFALSLAGLHAEVDTQGDTVIMYANKRDVVKPKRDVPGRGYSNSVEVSASVLPRSNYNVSASMVFGYRFNRYIFLGGGLGIAYFHEEYRHWDNSSEINHSIGIPVFVRAKFNFTKKRVSPYFGIDIGAAIFWDAKNGAYNYGYYGPDGYFLFRPHLGIDINVSDQIKPYIMIGGSVSEVGALFFGVGCKF